MQTPQSKQTNLYETDFYAWSQQQANLLRHQQWYQLDLANLIEEIESLGRKERQELRNRLSVLIGHLLKWEYQPTKRSRSWLATIRIQRLDTTEILTENPSLQSYLPEIIDKSYIKAIALATGETNLPVKTFPQYCPYSLEEILSDRFYPGEIASDDLME